jgi:hypothetical protein
MTTIVNIDNAYAPDEAAAAALIRRHSVAVHEAGHVIVGHSVGLICYRATTRPAPAYRGPLGPIGTASGGKTLWRRLGQWRRRPGERSRQMAVMAMGGLAAERLLYEDLSDEPFVAAVPDLKTAAFFLGLPAVIFEPDDEDWPPGWRSELLKPYAQAVLALRENWDALERVTEALYDRSTLDEAAIRGLL